MWNTDEALMNSHNRCKELSEKDLRELFAKSDEITKANLRHDARYGLNHEKLFWRSGYVQASPKLDRESIWLFHRRIDEARATQLGLKIV